MKWLGALVVLVLVDIIQARGLKASRAPDEGAVLSKRLEVENEALRKRNQQLESMMQMARAEVHRMDSEAAKRTRHRQIGNYGDAEVLKQEIEDLKQKLQVSENDKKDLVQTLQRMLSKNSTKIFQRQAEHAQEVNMALELRCGKDRQALEAQLAEANSQIKEANSKCDDTKEAAQDLQEENQALHGKLRDIHEELTKYEAENKDLTSNKVNLISTMQSLMRENSRIKHGLQQETDAEKREAKELVAAKATLTKLSKKAPAVATKKPAKTVSKAFPVHHMSKEAAAAQKAHLRTIDRYMVNVEAPSDDIDESTEQRLGSVQRQAELVAKGKVVNHLSDWLGFKKEVVKTAGEKDSATKVQKEKAPANDDEELDALVSEAKAMNTMEGAD
jgi:chromosome segregation ATPase